MKHWDDLNVVSLFLWPVSIVFRALAGTRRQLFKFGLLDSWHAPVPVIVVGNISVGGTGKTPVVIALVEWLKSRGYRPGVISRGYGGAKLLNPIILLADSDPQVVGDEPVLISKRTGVPVCVFPKRVKSAEHLLAHSDCNVLVADDGLQHYALQRDLEIIVIDGQKLHGNGLCLPAGPLREPVSRIDKQSLVLYNCQDSSDDGRSFTLMPEKFVALDQSEEKSLDGFTGCEVLACAGTASPQRFFSTLSNLGLQLRPCIFPDHHRFVPSDFKVAGNLPIIMTEKDAVKCAGFGLQNAWYLPVTTQLPEHLLTQIAMLLGKPKTHPQKKSHDL